MRFEISRGGSGLTYEIRNIVLIANKLKEFGVNIIWENIGDPVQKGEKIPDWMKEVLTEIIRDDASFAYSPTKGMDTTRQFLADISGNLVYSSHVHLRVRTKTGNIRVDPDRKTAFDFLLYGCFHGNLILVSLE